MTKEFAKTYTAITLVELTVRCPLCGQTEKLRPAMENEVTT